MDAIKEPSLRVVDIAVTSIDPNPNNPNEMSDEAFNRLVEEIREVGFLSPIIVVEKEDGRFKLLNGEHRWRAAMAANYEHIPSVVLSDDKFSDPDVFELVNIRLNEIRGKLSPEKMQPIYERVVAKYGEDNVKRVLGITQDDVYKKLIKKLATQYKKSVSPEVGEKIDKAVDNHSDPNKFSKAISKIIREAATQAQTSNCMIFKSSGKDHVVIQASETTFSAIAEIVRMCQARGVDINAVLCSGFVDILNRANDIFPDHSVELPQEAAPHP